MKDWKTHLLTVAFISIAALIGFLLAFWVGAVLTWVASVVTQ